MGADMLMPSSTSPNGHCGRSPSTSTLMLFMCIAVIKHFLRSNLRNSQCRYIPKGLTANTREAQFREGFYVAANRLLGNQVALPSEWSGGGKGEIDLMGCSAPKMVVGRSRLQGRTVRDGSPVGRFRGTSLAGARGPRLFLIGSVVSMGPALLAVPGRALCASTLTGWCI